jgi:DDE superfamily endonuclease
MGMSFSITSIIWQERSPLWIPNVECSSVDNASWHKAKRLNWHHFEVHFLPGYSPDFNPIERLWLRLKADFFSDFIAKSPEELTQRLCHALTSLMNSALFGNDFLQPLLASWRVQSKG